MPKLKTHSGSKKRFKVTSSGKVVAKAAGRRHGMRKRTNAQLREGRGTFVMFKADGEKVLKNFLVNA